MPGSESTYPLKEDTDGRQEDREEDFTKVAKDPQSVNDVILKADVFEQCFARASRRWPVAARSRAESGMG